MLLGLLMRNSINEEKRKGTANDSKQSAFRRECRDQADKHEREETNRVGHRIVVGS